MIKGILNKNQNILQIPVTPDGAMELGLSPCEGCNMARATWSSKGKEYDCSDECHWWKKYWRKDATK